MSSLLPPLFLQKEKSELGNESENAFSPDFDWLIVFVKLKKSIWYIMIMCTV